MAADKVPPVVKDSECLSIIAAAHPEATLQQIIRAGMRAARVTGCAVRSTWNVGGKGKAEVTVYPEDTYQGAQRRANKAGQK